MTKVKNTTKNGKGKQAGKVSAKGADSQNDQSANSSIIMAERNGLTRKFTKLTWGLLPPDKEGWSEVIGKPADLPTGGNDGGTVLTDEQKAIAFQTAFAKYKELHEEDPEDGLTTEELEELNSTKQAEIDANQVDHVLTQDDLDLNPQWAEEGHKVGDTIKVPKTQED